LLKRTLDPLNVNAVISHCRPLASSFRSDGGRACAIAETHGFMKAIMDAKSDRILGFTMRGAGEAIAVVQTAMLARIPYTVYEVPSLPTLS
jgi:pyruvate/2-oxoglutarate dehydrogenase complex dihydrolipoamide dehydrogenase (E3) component